MVLVGPEMPLINGITDFINNDPDLKHINVIGPSQRGSMLEGSKEFAKDFMNKYKFLQHLTSHLIHQLFLMVLIL